MSSTKFLVYFCNVEHDLSGPLDRCTDQLLLRRLSSIVPSRCSFPVSSPHQIQTVKGLYHGWTSLPSPPCCWAQCRPMGWGQYRWIWRKEGACMPNSSSMSPIRRSQVLQYKVSFHRFSMLHGCFSNATNLYLFCCEHKSDMLQQY